jgi:hypothetical protein
LGKVFTVDDISGDISEEAKGKGKDKERVEKVKSTSTVNH